MDDFIDRVALTWLSLALEGRVEFLVERGEEHL